MTSTSSLATVSGFGAESPRQGPASTPTRVRWFTALLHRRRPRVCSACAACWPARSWRAAGSHTKQGRQKPALLCYALGYEPPASFVKTQPRLPHPNLDVYVQESNNLQVWNQEVDAARRYVIIIVKGGIIADVVVIAGADLAQFDTTGTLTSKYQASRIRDSDGAMLVSERDTDGLIAAYAPGPRVPLAPSPVDLPDRGRVLDIAAFAFLAPMVGQTYDDPGVTQERNRGSVVHREACATSLGTSPTCHHGQFPDGAVTAVEVKLQLARTIDPGAGAPELGQSLGIRERHHRRTRLSLRHLLRRPRRRQPSPSRRLSSLPVRTFYRVPTIRRPSFQLQLQLRLPFILVRLKEHALVGRWRRPFARSKCCLDERVNSCEKGSAPDLWSTRVSELRHEFAGSI